MIGTNPELIAIVRISERTAQCQMYCLKVRLSLLKKGCVVTLAIMRAKAVMQLQQQQQQQQSLSDGTNRGERRAASPSVW